MKEVMKKCVERKDDKVKEGTGKGIKWKVKIRAILFMSTLLEKVWKSCTQCFIKSERSNYTSLSFVALKEIIYLHWTVKKTRKFSLCT